MIQNIVKFRYRLKVVLLLQTLDYSSITSEQIRIMKRRDQVLSKILLLTQFHSLTHEPNTGINKPLSLTDIMLNEDIIIEAIHELSPKSAAGPDCIPSSLLVNCATCNMLLVPPVE